MNSLKVTHISTFDNKGGAARAAFRLHSGLKAEGCDSRMVVGWKSEVDDDIANVVPNRTSIQNIRWRLILRADRIVSLQNLWLPWSGKFIRHPFVDSAEIINLHNVHGGGLSHRIIPKLAQIAPLVWTLHDQWALTGHCGFSYDCERWRTGCGKCPILKDDPAIAFDTTALLWRIKKWVYKRSDLVIVTPSKWLANISRESPLTSKFDVQTIPYGLDIDVFSPVPKADARHVLGLPQDAKVILFAAYSLDDQRKGGEYVLAALRQLAQDGIKNICFLTIGRGDPAHEFSELPYSIRHLGVITNDSMLATCYSAADIFLGPSLADNLPQTMIEAAACGTPTIAFRAGGTPEVVRHMETGYLAEDRCTIDLVRGLKLLLGNDELREEMASRSRQVAVSEYPLHLQARRYFDLYSQIIEERVFSMA